MFDIRYSFHFQYRNVFCFSPMAFGGGHSPLHSQLSDLMECKQRQVQVVGGSSSGLHDCLCVAGPSHDSWNICLAAIFLRYCHQHIVTLCSSAKLLIIIANIKHLLLFKSHLQNVINHNTCTRYLTLNFKTENFGVRFIKWMIQ